MRFAGIFLTLVAFSLVAAVPAKKAAKPKKKKPVLVETVIPKFQQAWDATQTYQADFKQTIVSTAIGSQDESEGILYVAKPKKIRWESKTDGSLQILNGERLTLIQENRRRKSRTVDIYPNVGRAVDTRLMRFLSGEAKFDELYKTSVVAETVENAKIQLIPKEGSKETFIAEITKNGYVLRALTTESVDSKVHLDFSNIKINDALDDGLFEYKPGPEDVVNEAKH